MESPFYKAKNYNLKGDKIVRDEDLTIAHGEGQKFFLEGNAQTLTRHY